MAGATTDSDVLNQVASGGARFERLVFTRNRRVMASVAEGGRTLRLHESFEAAPPGVLRAVGRLFSSRSEAIRGGAREEVRLFLSTTGASPAPRPTRRYPPDSRDLPHLRRLLEEFRSVNGQFFGGSLPEVPIRLSGRMRRRNGHFTSVPLEIAISRTLCDRAEPGEAERTLRHEMIHLWQHVSGNRPGHGEDFRGWARKLGIHPRAKRTVCWIRPEG